MIHTTLVMPTPRCQSPSTCKMPMFVPPRPRNWSGDTTGAPSVRQATANDALKPSPSVSRVVLPTRRSEVAAIDDVPSTASRASISRPQDRHRMDQPRQRPVPAHVNHPSHAVQGRRRSASLQESQVRSHKSTATNTGNLACCLVLHHRRRLRPRRVCDSRKPAFTSYRFSPQGRVYVTR